MDGYDEWYATEGSDDYSYNEDGSPERCDDCGSIIDKNDHCPKCDY